MKKMRQRLFSMLGYGRMLTRAGRAATALLTVAMLTLSAQTAKAGSKLFAKISTSDNTTMTLVCADATPSESGYTFTEYNGASSNPSTITSVIIDGSCAQYTGTTLYALFYNYSNLTTITGLSNLKTENVTTMNCMFKGCSSLTTLDLSGFNTAKVTNMGAMFEGCSGLTTLNLSGFNTAEVTTMRFMFYGCSSLTTLTLSSNFNTEKVETMENMFYNCSKLTSLNLSGWNTAKVTEMEYMFYGCSGLTTLNVTGWNTAKVTNMKYMFEGCSGLTTLDLSSFNTAKVQYMARMFWNCSSLTTIWVGPGWTNAALKSSHTDGKTNTFYGCTALVGGNGTAYNASNVSADYAIADLGTGGPGYLSGLKLLGTATSSTLTLTAGVPDGVKKTFNASTNWFGDASAKAAITSIVVDASCQNATAITTLESLFKGFSAATSISGLGNLNTANVTTMASMFSGCSALTLLDLSGLATPNVTNMGAMFYNCSNLKTIIVDDTKWNTTGTTGTNMFYNCSAIIGGEGCGLGNNILGSDFIGRANTSATGYLTGATRTLTATADGSGMKYWATFFNSAVGYSISGGTAYAGVYNSSTKKVELTSLGTNIPANTPVIICADAATVNMTLDNTIAAYGGTNNLIGIDVQTATPSDSYCLAIGNSGATDGKAGFFHFTGSNIPARRAYLTIAASAPNFIGFGDDENTTGLKAIDNGQLTIDNYYNLNGQRIVNPTKGLYIVNGKKVVIK